MKRLNVSLLVQNIFNYIIYLARLDVPNSLILPLTVSLIASRAGPKYLRGSYTSWSLFNTSLTALAEAIWFSVLTLILAVP